MIKIDLAGRNGLILGVANKRSLAWAIAERLDAARNAHAYDELVLVAEPRFLGLLRRALDRATAALVVASVDKDLVAFDAAELLSHLAAALRPQTPA